MKENFKPLDDFDISSELIIKNKVYKYYSLRKLSKIFGFDLNSLPFSVRVLMENIISHSFRFDKFDINRIINSIINFYSGKGESIEIPFSPTRIVMQDFTGVPAIVDLAAMREGIQQLGGKPEDINPIIKADLIIDHSVQVDQYGTVKAYEYNIKKEFARNYERYKFLKWGSKAFTNLAIIPPSSGIIHQINLEYLAQIVNIRAFNNHNHQQLVYDTIVGTDSHTTMINGLGVLGWGVGGIEAEAAMVGIPINIELPQVVGFELKGKLRDGINATDLVLTITKTLRDKGVVGKFVEFFGDGLYNLSLPDRATISNMCPEYGATIAFFPVDRRTLEYMNMTGRPQEHIEIIETYLREQNLFRLNTSNKSEMINYSETVSLDLGSVETSVAGPKKPHQYHRLNEIKRSFEEDLNNFAKSNRSRKAKEATIKMDGESFTIKDGSVVIAAITSCTNTSNPSVLIAAGLVAKKAVDLGLRAKPFVKTSFTPGSKAVQSYIESSGLLPYLEALGFHIVGFGCATCIGNSGPLNPEISKAIHDNNLYTVSVLSGNRNFEGRIHSDVRANYLASPPLVVAYSIVGNIDVDLNTEPIGVDPNGNVVYLKDIWPDNEEILRTIENSVNSKVYKEVYNKLLVGNEGWQNIEVASGKLYNWEASSTYIKRPPFFNDISMDIKRNTSIRNARALALFGDTITTDHISPAGKIPEDSPAGKWLISQGVVPEDFNTYGSRRGNHEVMVRGTFANIRIKNLLLDQKEGGYTIHFPTGKEMPIYDAAQLYKKEKTPLIILAGREYGSGSSRDWAAKGTYLLGIKAVVAKSFERIHRSNLIGMGVLPLQFNQGEGIEELGIKGNEIFNIDGISKPRQRLKVEVIDSCTNIKLRDFYVIARIDTQSELEYYLNGGILQYALKKIAKVES